MEEEGAYRGTMNESGDRKQHGSRTLMKRQPHKTFARNLLLHFLGIVFALLSKKTIFALHIIARKEKKGN